MIYYFASNKNLDNEILYPRVPKNRMKCEDEKVQRICVSQSINGCLSAISPNVGDLIYIHKCTSNKVVQPNLDQVIDSFLTGELWILESVKMEKILKIKITGIIVCSVFSTDLLNCLYSFEQISDEKI